jgi:hypothetical protein
MIRAIIDFLLYLFNQGIPSNLRKQRKEKLVYLIILLGLLMRIGETLINY